MLTHPEIFAESTQSRTEAPTREEDHFLAPDTAGVLG